MKQIFDWLREQIVHTAEDVSPNMDKLLVMYNVEKLLNEAEAKWGCHAICYLDSPCEYQNEDIMVEEADCCEWKFNEEDYSYDTSCGHCFDYHGYKFCSGYGKPIKISEV